MRRGKGNLLYLPLDKLMQGAAAATASAVAAEPVAVPQPAARQAGAADVQ